MVLIVRPDAQVLFVNSSFENSYGLSAKAMGSLSLYQILPNSALKQLLHELCENRLSAVSFDDTLVRPLGQPSLPVQVTISSAGEYKDLIVEIVPIEKRIRAEREYQLHDQSVVAKELIRNLAHEIKNPLGGIRGTAQLLQMELSGLALDEYIQVIIRETDRLQTLVDRLLEPHRKAQITEQVNIHEICEYVIALILAEFTPRLEVIRDYDTSIPEIQADKSQLMQSILNIARNAAQALMPQMAQNQPAFIEFRSRIVKHTPYIKKDYKLALELHIIDNGPGVPEEIRNRIFFPLITGKEGGSGLGLTIAQTFVQQHHGMIECNSRPGCTDFTIIIPL